MASREAVEAEQMRRKAAAETTGQCSVAGNNPVQTGFATGATRSTSEGKIDYEGHINPEVLAIFGEFMNKHRVQRDGQLRASDNWQQGIPIYRYVKSLIRHTFEFWRMWRGHAVVNPDSGSYFTFREVLSAMLFNTMGIIYEMQRKLVPYLDIPYMPRGEREMLEREDQQDVMKDPIQPTRKESEDYGGAMSGSGSANKAGPGATCGTSPVRKFEHPARREHILTEDHISARQVRDSILEEEGTYRLALERERY